MQDSERHGGHRESGGSPKHRRRSTSPRGSFLSRYIASRKLSKVLADIQEAKKYGIELPYISLRELYNQLQDARDQEEAHKRNFPHRPFLYDSGEDSQLQDDGLDQLMERVREEHKVKRHEPSPSSLLRKKTPREPAPGKRGR